MHTYVSISQSWEIKEVEGAMVKSEISSEGDYSSDVNKWEREVAPSHYILRIDSFSKLATTLLEGGLKHFKSKTFDASGYKWNFLVYPNGDEKTDSKGHISVSVCIEDKDALLKSWAKYADLKFFIYDQVRQKYSVFQVGGASSLHDFHSLKTESVSPNWFPVLCLMMLPVDISQLRLSVEEYLKPYLHLVDDKITCTKLLVHFMLRITNQKSGKQEEAQICDFFDPKSKGWGWTRFARSTDFLDLSEGSVDNNCIVIEAHGSRLGFVEPASTSPSEDKVNAPVPDDEPNKN
nr:MATH domain and coiled-coil domain-containing protein At3g58270 isoform X1 [Ipomoea batatas]